MKHNDQQWLTTAASAAGWDRRVRRTRRALADALLALAGQGPYEAITIRDITEQADVGYATFFRHYDSKDDLMLALFEDTMRELETLAGSHGGEFFQTEGQLIFNHVREHQALYGSVLDSLVFTRKLKKLLAVQVGQHVARRHRPRAKTSLMEELAVAHMVTSLLGLIEWWLARGLQPDVPQMAEIYDRLIIRATWQALLEAPQV